MILDQTTDPAIDIEIGDARQHPRRLPPVEPMPGRHQAELPIELAQGRFWQALDERLAVISFRAFVSDQQMSSRLKAVFESFAPGNSHVVRLYCAPSRLSAAGDIRRRNVD